MCDLALFVHQNALQLLQSAIALRLAGRKDANLDVIITLLTEIVVRSEEVVKSESK